ncbi:MAG: hypothetical protein E7280_03135 [Lachnospiraceae bacterium]|nr:hypothetical protein [Lachnospiraceae bacterium]
MGLKKLSVSLLSLMVIAGFAALLVWVSQQYGRHPDTMEQVLSQEENELTLSESEKSKNLLQVKLSPVLDSKLPMLKITTEKKNGVLFSQQETGMQLSIGKEKKKGGIKLLTYNDELEAKPSMALSFSEKTTLFEGGRGTQYTLLSGYHDKSLLRTLLTGRLYEYLGEDNQYSPFMKLVNVEVDGQYQGVYLLCENVEPGEDKIAIEGKAQATPKQSAFLMRQEPTEGFSSEDLKEGEDWFWMRRNNYRIRILSPAVSQRRKQEYATYCKDSLDHVYEDILNHNWWEITRELDISSAIRSLLTAEIANCSDEDRVNMYLYKEAGGKIAFGPFMGCDTAFGSEESGTSEEPFYQELMEIKAFRESFCKAYNRVAGETETFLHKKLNRIISLYGRDLENDYNYWEKDTDYGSEKMREAGSYEEQVTILQEWIHARFLRMSSLIREE